MTDFQAFQAAVDSLLAQPLVEQQRYLKERYQPGTGTTTTVAPLPLAWTPRGWGSGSA